MTPRERLFCALRGEPTDRTLEHGAVRLHADQGEAPGARSKKLLTSAEELEACCSLPLECDEFRSCAPDAMRWRVRQTLEEVAGHRC